MSGDYSESVALFSKPQSTYTGEPGEGCSESGKQNGSVQHDGGEQDGHPMGDGKGARGHGPPKGHSRAQPEWVPPEEESPSFDEIMGSIHEKAMSVVGFGRMQWMLYVVLGFGIMGDDIELVLTAYVLPGAERELCMDEQMKGWLGKYFGILFSISFIRR